jgi:hypothetical protein
MTPTTNQKAEDLEILDHRMTRITVGGIGASMSSTLDSTPRCPLPLPRTSFERRRSGRERTDAHTFRSIYPAAPLGVFRNDAISKVAREFDFMFGRLLRSLGCVVPDALREPAN